MRDEMCIALLEGTTPHVILARCHHDAMDGVPAYNATPRFSPRHRQTLRRQLRVKHQRTEAA